MRLSKRFPLLLLAVCLLASAGCSFKDLDKRFFVVAMGFDWTGKPNKPYLITLRLAIPAAKVGEGLAESQIERIEGSTIAEAVRNMKSHVDKELDFGHCRVFLFGESLAKQSLEEPMAWLSRRRDIQLISYVSVARPDALTVLRAKPSTERLAGNAFSLTFGKEGTVSPYTVTEMLFDSFRRFTEKGMDPLFPIIAFDGDSYVVEHLSLFDKNKQLLVLGKEETELFNLTANAFGRSGVVVDYEGSRLAYYISRVSKHVSVTKDAIPTVKLTLKLTGMVEQTPVVLTNDKLAEVTTKLEERVNETTEKLMTKIRDAGVDPYGLGLRNLGQHFGNESDWEHWKEVYPLVKFEVRTKVVIEKTGLIR